MRICDCMSSQTTSEYFLSIAGTSSGTKSHPTSSADNRPHEATDASQLLGVSEPSHLLLTGTVELEPNTRACAEPARSSNIQAAPAAQIGGSVSVPLLDPGDIVSTQPEDGIEDASEEQYTWQEKGKDREHRFVSAEGDRNNEGAVCHFATDTPQTDI